MVFCRATFFPADQPTEIRTEGKPNNNLFVPKVVKFCKNSRPKLTFLCGTAVVLLNFQDERKHLFQLGELVGRPEL